MSPCAPQNQTCSTSWPVFALRVHSVGANGARCSSMASAWQAYCTMSLSSVSWNWYLACVRLRKPRNGMPSAPTVSQAPIILTGMGSAPEME